MPSQNSMHTKGSTGKKIKMPSLICSGKIKDFVLRFVFCSLSFGQERTCRGELKEEREAKRAVRSMSSSFSGILDVHVMLLLSIPPFGIKSAACRFVSLAHVTASEV